MAVHVTISGSTVTSTLVWQHTNVFAGGKLLGTYDKDGLHFYFDDALGTRRARRNRTSLPYGDALSCLAPGESTYFVSINTPTEHHFTGKERDTESGNDYFGARYYSSNMGRFTSPDWSAKESPVPYATFDDPQSLNLYAYVRNNPLTRFDADGHVIDWRPWINAAKNVYNQASQWLASHNLNHQTEGSGSLIGAASKNGNAHFDIGRGTGAASSSLTPGGAKVGAEAGFSVYHADAKSKHLSGQADALTAGGHADAGLSLKDRNVSIGAGYNFNAVSASGKLTFGMFTLALTGEIGESKGFQFSLSSKGFHGEVEEADGLGGAAELSLDWGRFGGSSSVKHDYDGKTTFTPVK